MLLGCRESPGADPELIAFDLNKLSDLRDWALLPKVQQTAGEEEKKEIRKVRIRKQGRCVGSHGNLWTLSTWPDYVLCLNHPFPILYVIDIEYSLHIFSNMCQILVQTIILCYKGVVSRNCRRRIL